MNNKRLKLMKEYEGYTGLPTLNFDKIIEGIVDEIITIETQMLRTCGCCGGESIPLEINELHFEPENGLCAGEFDDCIPAFRLDEVITTLEIPIQAYNIIMTTLQMDLESSSICTEIKEELEQALESIVELDQEENDDFTHHIHSQECHDLENEYALNGACTFKELTYALAADLAQRDVQLAEALCEIKELRKQNSYKDNSSSTTNNGDEKQ